MKKQTQKSGTKRSALFWIVIAALVVLLAMAFDCRLCVRYYDVPTPEITSPVRIVLITDLHACYYGNNQETLIRAIDAQSPDLVLLGGDIFDDEMADSNTEIFLQGISGRYPCYYVTGNHECWSGKEDFQRKMSILAQYHVTILSNQCQTIEINGNIINLCGINDPDAYMVEWDPESNPQEYLAAQNGKLDTFRHHLDALQAQTEHFTILLSHRPELFESYVAEGFDLVLCGHAHGGQWRIPGILNGVFAPNQGIFPPYAGGKYENGDTTMIVSRGLARESTLVPRIFNPPELVVITLT